MIDTLKIQYALLQQARAVAFNFIETTVGDDLDTAVPVYENQTIRDLLEHTAQCYIHWLVYFATHQPVGSLKHLDFSTLQHIRERYVQVDEIVAAFLEKFKSEMDRPISGIHSASGSVSATPIQLFTHVFSHEFHHKGQIVLMCRILGYPPPETDVSLFF